MFPLWVFFFFFAFGIFDRSWQVFVVIFCIVCSVLGFLLRSALDDDDDDDDGDTAGKNNYYWIKQRRDNNCFKFLFRLKAIGGCWHISVVQAVWVYSFYDVIFIANRNVSVYRRNSLAAKTRNGNQALTIWIGKATSIIRVHCIANTATHRLRSQFNISRRLCTIGKVKHEEKKTITKSSRSIGFDFCWTGRSASTIKYKNQYQKNNKSACGLVREKRNNNGNHAHPNQSKRKDKWVFLPTVMEQQSRCWDAMKWMLWGAQQSLCSVCVCV